MQQRHEDGILGTDDRFVDRVRDAKLADRRKTHHGNIVHQHPADDQVNRCFINHRPVDSRPLDHRPVDSRPLDHQQLHDQQLDQQLPDD